MKFPHSNFAPVATQLVFLLLLLAEYSPCSFLSTYLVGTSCLFAGWLAVAPKHHYMQHWLQRQCQCYLLSLLQLLLWRAIIVVVLVLFLFLTFISIWLFVASAAVCSFPLARNISCCASAYCVECLLLLQVFLVVAYFIVLVATFAMSLLVYLYASC